MTPGTYPTYFSHVSSGRAPKRDIPSPQVVNTCIRGFQQTPASWKCGRAFFFFSCLGIWQWITIRMPCIDGHNFFFLSGLAPSWQVLHLKWDCDCTTNGGAVSSSSLLTLLSVIASNHYLKYGLDNLAVSIILDAENSKDWENRSETPGTQDLMSALNP